MYLFAKEAGALKVPRGFESLPLRILKIRQSRGVIFLCGEEFCWGAECEGFEARLSIFWSF